ncbi:MAG: energy transducer TonB [Phycisphaerae bacterium]
MLRSDGGILAVAVSVSVLLHALLGIALDRVEALDLRDLAADRRKLPTPEPVPHIVPRPPPVAEPQVAEPPLPRLPQLQLPELVLGEKAGTGQALQSRDSARPLAGPRTGGQAAETREQAGRPPEPRDPAPSEAAADQTADVDSAAAARQRIRPVPPRTFVPEPSQDPFGTATPLATFVPSRATPADAPAPAVQPNETPNRDGEFRETPEPDAPPPPDATPALARNDTGTPDTDPQNPFEPSNDATGHEPVDGQAEGPMTGSETAEANPSAGATGRQAQDASPAAAKPAASSAADPGRPVPSSDRDIDAFATELDVAWVDGRLVAQSGRGFKSVRPRYSFAARQSVPRLPVRMVFAVTVTPDGQVTDVRVLQSSGSDALDHDVRLSLFLWTFEPDPAETTRTHTLPYPLR